MRYYKKNHFDIYLINIQIKKNCYYKKNFKSHAFYHSVKNLVKINFKLLKIAFKTYLAF